MLKLIDPGTVPPGGFRWLCQETKTWIQAPSMAELVDKSAKHRSANNLGVPDEHARHVEEQLCSFMPPGTCKHEAGTVLSGARRLSFAEIVAGTVTIGAWLLKGAKKVDQAEAERRGAICLACPFNQNFDGCTTCAEKDLREAISSFMGASKTPFDANLHSCGICGCTLKAAVWFPKDLLVKHADPDSLAAAPSFCWKRI